MKNLKLLVLLTLCCGLIPSCCDEVIPYFKPSSLENEVYLDGQLLADLEDTELFSTEGLQLWLSFGNVEFIAEQQFNFSFQNTCLATQPCPEDGHLGLKSPVSTILITSSAEFQGMSAGEDISQYFHVLEFLERDEEDNPVYTEESVTNSFGRFSYLVYDSSYVELNFSELPDNNETHEFSVELTFEDGTSLSSTSEPVQF